MKKLFLFLVALVSALTVSAQDVIVKTDGSTVLCKVVEVNGSAVVYLKWSDLEGPRYAIECSQISTVNYQDGRQVRINEQSTNAYAPNNQQTGNWNYNDNALIALDQTRYNPYLKKVKKIQKIGWIVGGSLIAVGITGTILGITLHEGGDYNESNAAWITGAIAGVGGIATLTGCLIRANQIKNRAYQLGCAPIIQHEFELNNGNSLAAGIDLLRDNQFKTTALGIGLKFNF